MIDLTGWDKIEFNEIAAGNTVLMVRKDTCRTFLYEGKVLQWDGVHKWWDMSGNWYASNDQEGVMTSTFYRKPFVFPTAWGSVIQGDYISGSDAYFYSKLGKPGQQEFVLCQKNMWRNHLGNGFCVSELKGALRNLKVLREGV